VTDSRGDLIEEGIRVAVRPLWMAAAFALTPWIGLAGLLLMPDSPGLLGAVAFAVPLAGVIWKVAWVLSDQSARWLGSPTSWSVAILVGLFGGRSWAVAACVAGFALNVAVALALAVNA